MSNKESAIAAMFDLTSNENWDGYWEAFVKRLKPFCFTTEIADKIERTVADFREKFRTSALAINGLGLNMADAGWDDQNVVSPGLVLELYLGDDLQLGFAFGFDLEYSKIKRFAVLPPSVIEKLRLPEKYN